MNRVLREEQGRGTVELRRGKTLVLHPDELARRARWGSSAHTRSARVPGGLSQGEGVPSPAGRAAAATGCSSTTPDPVGATQPPQAEYSC